MLLGNADKERIATMTNYLIVGASRGLGALFARELPRSGDTAWLVSRSQPDLSSHDGVQRMWIQADLAAPGIGAHIAAHIGDHALDVCLYNAGVWEKGAFTDQYNFEQDSSIDIERLIAINLTAAITTVQKVLPQLRRSTNATILFIGSHSGLDNSSQPEVANTASKFGLRGITHALREVVRKDAIAVTCLNLGNVGTITYKDDTIHLEPVEEGYQGIPPADLIQMLRCIFALSRGTCVKEIDLSAIADTV